MIARDISEGASYFAFNRLPELYAGIKRAEGTFPVQYLGANVPQAWAAGSVFHLLQAILGLQADAHKKTLYVNPVLPQWLPEITLLSLRVGPTTITIRFWREEDKSQYDVLSSNSEIEVKAGSAPSIDKLIETGGVRSPSVVIFWRGHRQNFIRMKNRAAHRHEPWVTTT